MFFLPDRISNVLSGFLLCWRQDAGFWILDSGYWILDTGNWIISELSNFDILIKL